VKPGITSIWHIDGRRSVSFTTWMELDMQFIDKWSFWLDLQLSKHSVTGSAASYRGALAGTAMRYRCSSKGSMFLLVLKTVPGLKVRSLLGQSTNKRARSMILNGEHSNGLLGRGLFSRRLRLHRPLGPLRQINWRFDSIHLTLSPISL
jgi:hypothetical protein